MRPAVTMKDGRCVPVQFIGSLLVMTEPILRSYQQEAEQRCYAAWHAGARNVIVVMPTGAGKTVTLANIMRRMTAPSIAIAHRQELVSQISLALARYGVRHRIIGSANTIRSCVQLHVIELGTSYYNATAPVAVASVDTLVRRDASDPLFRQTRLWVCDECFPAGTLIDGRPIETLRVGDMTTAFNETTGMFEQRRIVQLFKNIAPKQMVRIRITHHVVESTSEHPFWTRRGWVAARELTTTDEVLCYDNTIVQGMPSTVSTYKNNEALLQQNVSVQVAGQAIIGSNEQDKQEVRIGANDREQSDAKRRFKGEDETNTCLDQSQATSAGWQRKAGEQCRTDMLVATEPTRVQTEHNHSHEYVERIGLSKSLQAGRSEPHAENCDRNRRIESLRNVTSSTGQKEDRISHWTRVESIEIYERTGTDRSDDGFVYNIEVDGLHTYIANGIVVHNCHHLLVGNKWGKVVEMFPNAFGLGVTATPVRADGKGLGRHHDGVMDVMIVGPSMRDLIRDGYLTEYRVFAPPNDLNLSDVTVTAGGDYSPEPLRRAVRRSHIHGDVVSHYLRIAPGKLGITFAVDVESAVELAAAYRQQGVPAEALSAKTPDNIRYKLLRQFAAGEIKQLCNVDLFSEGFDLPAIEVCSMARPTQSYGLYVQAFGRALRPMDGKTHATIIDHVGNTLLHGLPDAPRDWTLDRRDRRARAPGDSPIQLRSCLNCAGVYERSRTVCPYCGTVVVPSGRSSPDMVDGDLAELTPDVLARMRGEIAQADTLRIPIGAGPEIVGRKQREHRERMEAQQVLRDKMMLWGGQRTARGMSLAEAQREFFLRFNIDVAAAQLLNRADAMALTERIKL